MLRMAEIGYIKDLYEKEGLSLREIAKRTKKDFRTVRKYAYQNNWSPEVKVRTDAETFPVMGEYIAAVNEWLIQDEKEPRKQRHTVKRIFNRLCKEKGYTGSYGSVKRYVAIKKVEMGRYKESFLPLAHPPGHAQVDFGRFKYYDGNGEAQKGYALIMSLVYSNSGWMQVYRSENQECLLTGLKTIFYHIGCVPKRIRCDNMSSAVAQILEGTKREMTDGFHRFMLHHRFEADFCAPGKGNEKGNVENKVGYTRRNMLVPVPVITDFESYNRELLRMCDEDHERGHYKEDKLIRHLWEEDKEQMLSLPEYEYEVFSYESTPVNKYGEIKIDRAIYPLSPELSGSIVQVKIYFDKIEAYYDRSLLKTLKRSYKNKGADYDWKDYLPTLVKKPGATEHTRFFNQMPKLWQSYIKSTVGQERKTAIMLLSEIVSDGNEDLCDEALELAREYGRMDVDSIRQCYLFISKPENHPEPLKLTLDPPILNYRPDLAMYDALTNRPAERGGTKGGGSI